jgi:hypothetical protein
MIAMATNKRSTSSTTATEKTTVNHLLLGCTKRDASTVSTRVPSAAREAAHVIRIMVCLHCAKDFSSVLRLYGIQTVQRPNEK